MFKLFKKKEKEDWQLEKQMLLNILSQLPVEYQFLSDQINDGLIRGFGSADKSTANKHKVLFNVAVLNKYEKKEKGFFRITGPEVLNLNTNTFVQVDIYYYANILQSYATPMTKEFRPDIQNVRVRKFYLQSLDGEDFARIKPILDKADMAMVNPNDVYEVILDGRSYFHLKDLEDGDFIGISEDKKVYKITHDPYNLEELSEPLSTILKSKK
jgi:hypothetical protein